MEETEKMLLALTSDGVRGQEPRIVAGFWKLEKSRKRFSPGASSFPIALADAHFCLRVISVTLLTAALPVLTGYD